MTCVVCGQHRTVNSKVVACWLALSMLISLVILKLWLGSLHLRTYLRSQLFISPWGNYYYYYYYYYCFPHQCIWEETNKFVRKLANIYKSEFHERSLIRSCAADLHPAVQCTVVVILGAGHETSDRVNIVNYFVIITGWLRRNFNSF